MQSIRFFSRQVVAGTDGAAAGTYSDIYDVGQYSMIVAELRVYTASPATAGISVDIEQSMGPVISFR